MAQLIINPIKYLQSLPPFDGNNDDLQTFIDLVDRFYPFLSQYDATIQPLFFDIIKSRLKGKALLALNINCHIQTWPELKSILINNFSDKLSCEELFDEMRSVTFKTNSVDFYNELRQKLKRLNNKTLLLLGQTDALQECTKNNRKSALNFFIQRLPEPMKSVLVCREPNSIEDSIDILFKAGYAYTGIQNSNKHSNTNLTVPNANNNSFEFKKFNHNRNHYNGYKDNLNSTYRNYNYNSNYNNNIRNNYRQTDKHSNNNPLNSDVKNNTYRYSFNRRNNYNNNNNNEMNYNKNRTFNKTNENPDNNDFYNHGPQNSGFNRYPSQYNHNPKFSTQNEAEPMEIGMGQVLPTPQNFRRTASQVTYPI